MKRAHSSVFLASLGLAVFAFSFLTSPVQSQPACTVDSAQRSKFQEALAENYEITEGTITFNATCFPDSPTCIGANPVSPYGRYDLPMRLLFNLSTQGFQFAADEAIVFLGCTPPPARYYGLQVRSTPLPMHSLA